MLCLAPISDFCREDKVDAHLLDDLYLINQESAIIELFFYASCGLVLYKEKIVAWNFTESAVNHGNDGIFIFFTIILYAQMR